VEPTSRGYERALLEEERDRDDELREVERREDERVERDFPDVERRDVERERFLGDGTLAPFSRASDNPIAIACFRLVTFPPCPDFPRFKVPFLRRRIALSTDLEADSP
jgi:hypothetical protein